jgi:hypothetical protein
LARTKNKAKKVLSVSGSQTRYHLSNAHHFKEYSVTIQDIPIDMDQTNSFSIDQSHVGKPLKVTVKLPSGKSVIKEYPIETDESVFDFSARSYMPIVDTKIHTSSWTNALFEVVQGFWLPRISVTEQDSDGNFVECTDETFKTEGVYSLKWEFFDTNTGDTIATRNGQPMQAQKAFVILDKDGNETETVTASDAPYQLRVLNPVFWTDIKALINNEIFVIPSSGVLNVPNVSKEIRIYFKSKYEPSMEQVVPYV